MMRTSSGSDFRAQTAWIGLLPEKPTVRQLGPRGSVGYSSMISHPVRASSSSTTVILSAWRSLSACLESSYPACPDQVLYCLPIHTTYQRILRGAIGLSRRICSLQSDQCWMVTSDLRNLLRSLPLVPVKPEFRSTQGIQRMPRKEKGTRIFFAPDTVPAQNRRKAGSDRSFSHFFSLTNCPKNWEHFV